MEWGGSSSPLTQPPPAKDVDEATLALTKRARKRSRYLSPPYYTGTDVQVVEVAGEEELPPPDVSAAEALPSLRAAALCYGQAVDPAVLRFLALYRKRNRRTTAETFDIRPDSRAATAGDSHIAAAGGSAGHTKLNLSAGPAMPRPYDGSLALAILAKKKKNPQGPPTVKQQRGAMQNAAALGQATNGPIWASKSTGFAVNATYGVTNPAPQEKTKKKYKKRRTKSVGHEQQHFRNPAALVLDFAEETPLPSREDLISTFRRFGFVIDSQTDIAGDKRSARVAFTTRDEAEVAYNCACVGSLGTFGPPYVVPSLQYLPPIISSAPPPGPKLPLKDIRSNLVMMISSLNRRSSSSATAAAVNSPEEAMPAMGNLVGDMQVLLAKVDKMLQCGSATAHHR